MAQNQIDVRLVIRNDVATNWQDRNPVLLLGEFGYESDTGLIKVGDNSRAWNELPYFNKDTLSDNLTIETNNNVLSLKNWGKQYYKFNEENNNYEIQVVDAEHPWPAGLILRSSLEANGSIELAWYEQDMTLDRKIVELQTIVEGKLNRAGDTMTGSLILADGFSAASEKVVDDKIAQALANVGSLKREIVEILPDPAQANENILYMVKKQDSDSYEEYILINVNGTLAFEKIGDTTVDLTAYVQKVPTAIENNIPAFAADGALVDSNISAQVVKAHLENTEIHVTQEEKTAWNNKVSANEIPPIVEGVLMANIIEGNGLTVGEEGISLSIATETSAGAMSPEHVQKLNSVFAASALTGALIGNEEAEINDDKKMIIPIGGEKLGVVKSTTVENGIAIAEDGTMSVNSISFSKIYTDDSEEIIFSGGGA